MTSLPFIPAAQLKQTYGVFGHFYSVKLKSGEMLECRSVLEIADHQRSPDNPAALSAVRPDAVFIMMNPGSSRPLVDVSNQVLARHTDSLSISLVPTRPDITQYQVMRLMRLRQWRHVRVLNLSDLRYPRSADFFTAFQRLEVEQNFDAHSIFAESRQDELTLKLPRSKTTPVVLAWGISDKLTPLINRCLSRLSPRARTIGLQKPGSPHKYRHPLPSLQKDQRRWIEQINQQFQN